MDACRYCKQPLAEGARKCPECLGWQGRFLPDMQSPKGLAFVMASMALFMVPMFVALHAIEHPAGPGVEEIVISESTLHHYDRGRHYIAIVGKLRNESAHAGKRPHFEARFYDSEGKLIDAFASDVYDLVLPAHDEVGFRLRAEAHQDESRYATFELRLTAIQGSRR